MLRRGLLAFLFSALIAATTGARAGEFIPVALSGQFAPGDPTGSSYGGFLSLQLNDAGDVAFTTELAINRRGIWLAEASGGTHMVVRQGQPATGLAPGAIFSNDYNTFERFLLDDDGRILLQGVVAGGGFQDSGALYSADPLGLTLVVHAGSQAPGLAAGVKHDGSGGSLNAAAGGHVSFRSLLTGTGVTPTSNLAIYTGTVGAVFPIARTGDPAPGMGSGAIWDHFRNANEDHTPQIRADGTIAFLGRVTGPGIDLNTDCGIWMGQPNALQPIARENAPVHDTPGLFYGQFKTPALNGNNMVAFGSSLRGLGHNGLHEDAAIFAGTPGDEGKISHIVRAGQAAPGGALPAGTFQQLYSYAIADNGDVAFTGHLTGAGINDSNNGGIWRARRQAVADPHSSDYPLPPELIVREGQPAPGTNGVFELILDFDMNSAGDMVFFASNTVEGQLRDGLWTVVDGEVSLLAFEGSPFEVAPGDIRTLRFVSPVINNPEPSTGLFTRFNDRRQVAFAAGFTDGSGGVFLSTVPEPATSSLLIGICAIVFARFRRGR